MCLDISNLKPLCKKPKLHTTIVKIHTILNINTSNISFLRPMIIYLPNPMKLFLSPSQQTQGRRQLEKIPHPLFCNKYTTSLEFKAWNFGPKQEKMVQTKVKKMYILYILWVVWGGAVVREISWLLHAVILLII